MSNETYIYMSFNLHGSPFCRILNCSGGIDLIRHLLSFNFNGLTYKKVDLLTNVDLFLFANYVDSRFSVFSSRFLVLRLQFISLQCKENR